MRSAAGWRRWPSCRRPARRTPARLRRSAVSMTNASATLVSCLRQAGELRFEEASNLLVGDAAIAQAADGVDDHGLGGAQLLGGLLCPAAGRHERAGAVAQLDDALVFELPVRPG